jgi:hypothetical protein
VAKYFHSMVYYLREHVLSGLSSNSDVARVLSHAYGQNIEAGDVARWRRQHKRLNEVIVCGMDNMNAAAVGVVAGAIHDGDVATARWWLERRNTLFKPTAKIEGGGRGGDLDDLLKQRMSEDDLYALGVLRDGGNDDDD